MRRREFPSIPGLFTTLAALAAIVMGLAVLLVRLYTVQIEEPAGYTLGHGRQSIRTVQTAGLRGRILDRNGNVLAGNRESLAIVCNTSAFQQGGWNTVSSNILAAIDRLTPVIGRKSRLDIHAVSNHVRRSLPMPLVVWRDASDAEIARLEERQNEFPAFGCEQTEERTYPHGTLASHLIGYVGRSEEKLNAGDSKINYLEKELRGRTGVEFYYDGYLRGVPGERRLTVDNRGFTCARTEVTKPGRGPDLVLNLDLGLQRAVEDQLAGHRGACAVIDPRNGEVLALASAPSFDPRSLTPVFDQGLYALMSSDPDKPMLDRATAGAYAPGSTFKPITALAALMAGVPDTAACECDGVFELGKMQLRCAAMWGHGPLAVREAIAKSCNVWFCNFGYDIGTNAVCAMARRFGLGSKTGIDFGRDVPGVVPEGEWKKRVYNEKWYPGDLVQMSIGQGMLLVTPLQMARVAGAIATGKLVTPHLNRELKAEARELGLPEDKLNVVREGMRMVVTGGDDWRGTGWRGGSGVAVPVAGKTGTAEIGKGATRRKNTWFIAYAPYTNATLAVAMVIENGASGGGTTAPKVAEILKYRFGSVETKEEQK